MNIEGKRMIRLAEELWPLNRSLSGEGTRESLRILKRELSNLEISKFQSGSQVFDWVVPPEWNCYEAYILSPDGRKICDFSNNNLHLVGYSEPIEASVTLAELQEHLFSLPDQPNAIPYVTSYYKRNWGFCLAEQDRRLLVEGEYKVIIRSEFSNSGLDYGELVIPGISDREVFFSTYLCHPSMANNELSGPILAVQLAKHLQKMDNFYTYRFIFIPETIGSIAYMASNLSNMKKNMLAGFVLTCLGDERAYSYIPSRKGGTIADLAALSTFQELGISPILYGWQDRGSDERQYCSPGADLPVCSVTRSKYGTYPEYHTSLDTLGEVVTIDGLQGSFDFYLALISKLDTQRFPRMTVVGEPQLGKRGLYPNTSIKDAYADVRSVMDFISMLDGTIETEDAIKKSGVDKAHGHAFLNRLIEEELVEN
jgi:aminopeptidase-like protein